MNPPFVFGFIGMYENAKLKLDTTIELGSKELTIAADTIYNLPDEVKNGFTLVRYFEITKINDSTYNEPYLAFIYKKKLIKTIDNYQDTTILCEGSIQKKAPAILKWISIEDLSGYPQAE